MNRSTLLMACVAAVVLCTGLAAPGWSAGTDLAASLAAAQVGYEIYQVCAGDTIENIAARYGVTPESIRSVNHLSESAEIAPGQSLAIVMPNRPRIVVPKPQTEARPPQDERADDIGDGPLNVRYAIATKACTITSGLPPIPGRTLYQCDKGTRVIVNSRQGDYLGVVMADGSTGWASASSLELTDEMISADELVRLLQGGTEGGRTDIVQEAQRYLGIPYRYGGSLPYDVDCSLLVQTAFAARGIRLPRTAAEQCGVGRPVSTSELQPGDRLYFMNRSGRISHTAIYMGNGQFIHASARRGRVAVDSFSDSFYRSIYYGARR